MTIWYDVDTALSEVPVNVVPLTDDTDFKTIEGAVAYNASGMALNWHFCTTAGAYTVTAVTPTTGGDYDWTDQGTAGVYTIEIPASGGASINNDTEGFGWFTGVATGVLPWAGPMCGFRAAAMNNSMIDAASGGVLAPTTAGRALDVTATGEAGLDFTNALTAVGSIPVLGWLENGTMQAGSAAGTAVLRSATSLADDLIIGSIIYITGGTGAGQSRVVYDWVSATDTASVSPGWTTTPDDTSTYAVFPAPPAPTNSAAIPNANVTHWIGTACATPTVAGVPEVDLTHVAGSTTDVSTIPASVAAIDGRIPAALVGGRMDATVDGTGMESGAVAAILDAALADSVPADGALPTVRQALYIVTQFLTERSVSGTTLTIRKVDGSTALMTFTLSDATSPVSITRAT